MHPDELLDALRAEAAAFSDAVRGGLTHDVPACPGWTVETLANHLGRVHRWGTAIVAERATDRPPFPARPDEVTVAWFDEGVEAMLAAFADAGPDAKVWSWAPSTAAHQARFWFRRMAVETALHRWDAEQACRTGEPQPVAAELALAGIDEVLDAYLPAQVHELGEAAFDIGGSLHLHATDDPHGEWIVRLEGGEPLVGHGHEKGDAAVRGTASDLLLLVWGRRSPEQLEVFGDGSVLDRFLSLPVPAP